MALKAVPVNIAKDITAVVTSFFIYYSPLDIASIINSRSNTQVQLSLYSYQNEWTREPSIFPDHAEGSVRNLASGTVR